MTAAREVWQSYDCPVQRTDMDLFDEDMVFKGQAFHCAHCGGNHVAQALDEFGAPRFGKDGKPKLKIRGHDVEEFVGVVKRYGPSVDVKRLVDAANAGPELRLGNIAHACGTCLKVAA